MANDVRPVSSGNEPTYHLLEVAHSYKKSITIQLENDNVMGRGEMGFGTVNLALHAPSQVGGV